MTTPMTRRAGLAACLGLLAAATGQAQAGLLETLTGKSGPDLGPPTQRSWQIAEFSSVQLVAREAGSPPNQQPATLDAEALKPRLLAIRASAQGKSVPLFESAELAELLPVLVRALSLATPDDDVLLLSTFRRGGSLAVPLAVTARLFVQDDRLQLIVHDARLAFVEAYRRSRIKPQFVHGSRTQAGPVVLSAEGLTPRRDDWLALPLDKAAPAAEPEAAAARPAPPAPAPATPSAPATPANKAAPASARGDEVEEQLLRLKRLRAKDLISEEEYQQMRREALQKIR